MADASYPTSPYHKLDGTFVVPSGASIDVESGGALKMAGSEVNLAGASPVVYCLNDSVSLAEIKAGKTLLAAVAGRTITVVDWSVTAIGGAATTSTAVTLSDTAGSPVLIATIAVAALTEDAVVKPNTATHVTDGAAGIGRGLTAEKGITAEHTGTAMTVLTSLQIVIQYTISDA